jgi:hypothetical protein
MYLSGTPSSIIFFSVILTLAVVNGVLLFLQRKVAAVSPVEAAPASQSKK